MSVKQMFQLESETVTGATVKIPFEYTNRESIPEGKEVGNCIVVSPLKVVTWFKLKPLLLMFGEGDLDKVKELALAGFSEELAALMLKYDEVIFETVCTGIHNKRGNMPEWFRKVLRDNCTWQDLCILLNAILFRIGCNPFLSSITALKVVSPLREEEIIALQENAGAWAHKAASCSSQS